MRYNHSSLQIQFSGTGGRCWSDLDDATFDHLVKEWRADKVEVLAYMREGKVFQSPHVEYFCYRAVWGQLPLAL